MLRKYLHQEIQLMQAADHPNIVKLHRTFEGIYPNSFR